MHRMTGWIRAELGAAAARGGDFARARLLRLDLAPPGASPLPSLAEVTNVQTGETSRRGVIARSLP